MLTYPPKTKTRPSGRSVAEWRTRLDPTAGVALQPAVAEPKPVAEAKAGEPSPAELRKQEAAARKAEWLARRQAEAEEKAAAKARLAEEKAAAKARQAEEKTAAKNQIPAEKPKADETGEVPEWMQPVVF